MKLTHALNDIAHRFGLHLTRNRVIGFHVGRNSVFNPFVVQKRLVPHCDVIFDAGAYIGDVSRLYSRMYPEATIYAFEPTPAAQEALGQIGPRVVPIASAISSREGTATLHVNTLPQTNSLHPLAESERRYYPKEAQPAETIEVPLTTIDAFCQSRRLAGPDILKMDIQCHEVEALRGAEATLKSGAIKLIYTEVTFVPHYEEAESFDALLSLLRGHDYSLFGFYDFQSGYNGQLFFGNAIFVSRELRETVVDTMPEEP
jgi:FkbM family methyltransferase